MRWGVATSMVVSMMVVVAHSFGDQMPVDAQTLVDPEKQQPMQVPKVKRRWTKRAKPGAPKARQAFPSRKKDKTQS